VLEGVGDAGAPAQRWMCHLPEGSDPDAVDLLAEGSLPAAWARRWRAQPGRRVVCDPDGVWLTGADLTERTATVAGRLARAGLRPGDRLLLSGGASSAFVVAHVAAMRSGLVVVPVNASCSRRELEAVVTHARPRGAVLEAEALRSWAAEADPDLVVTDVDVDLPDGPVPSLDDVASRDPALLPYTSGTTGSPKGVALSHGNLLASVEALRLAWRWTEDDALVLCLPLFHVHGLGVGLHGGLLSGGTVLLQRSFDAETVLAAATDATLFFGVPTMYTRLVAAEGADRLAGLRLCVSGSAPMSEELHAQVLARCGQVVLERYGMTETVMLASNPLEGERRAGSVGLPLPGVQLRLGHGDEIQVRGPNVFGGYLDAPADDAPGSSAPSDDSRSDDAPGSSAPADDGPGSSAPSDDTPSDDAPGGSAPSNDSPSDDAPGSSAPSDDSPSDDAPGSSAPSDDARGGSAPSDDAPSSEAAGAFTADGWFRTGDVGALDHDGYVRIVGRAKELIITGGYNVYPREVEDVLRLHPHVTDVAVVGTPSSEWGETVTAYVEADDGFDPEAVLAWAAEQLAPYKRPRLFHRVEALPRNGMGKVVRAALRPPHDQSSHPQIT